MPSDLTPFGLSLSKPRPSAQDVQPFDKLRANGGGNAPQAEKGISATTPR